MEIVRKTTELPPSRADYAKLKELWPEVEKSTGNEWLQVQCVDHKETVAIRSGAARRGYRAKKRELMVYISKREGGTHASS
jgi:hypothetical protein